jgi:glucose-1-phosphate thymidylyltransferase
MTDTLKIVIPTAGWATRMRPQTWSKPKPLVSVAGKTALDHLLDSLQSVPDPRHTEYVIIVGSYLGETQIPPFVQEHYPDYKVHYVLQAVMRGQSDALNLGREYLRGPLVVIFSDTLIETDFSFLADEKADGVAWVKATPDPRRFGVAEVDTTGRVTRLIEKPQTLENNLVVVGCYYFKRGEELISAVEEQIRRGSSLNGEFFLTGAINIMLERGAQFRTQKVSVWLDTGTIEAALETNRYLLEHGRENSAGHLGGDVQINRPVFVHPTAQIVNSTIGPHVSIGADCVITGSRIENSILEAGVTVNAAALKGSFIGRQAQIQGSSADDPPLTLNIGDKSSVVLK